MKFRPAAMVAMPVLALSIAGCGSGRYNAVYTERSVVNGAIYHAGGLGIYNAFYIAPAPRGGTAVLEFSTYADNPQDATVLRSVTSPISDGPAQLARVGAVDSSTTQNGAATGTLPVQWQQGTGATLSQATLTGIKTSLTSAAYYPATFTFGNGITATLNVPVAQIGAVQPFTTVPPTAFPEEPFVVPGTASTGVPDPTPTGSVTPAPLTP